MVTTHKHFLLHEEKVEVESCTVQQFWSAKYKNKGAEWKKKKIEETHRSLEHILFARILGILSSGTFSNFSIKNLFLVINSATLAEVSDELSCI